MAKVVAVSVKFDKSLSSLFEQAGLKSVYAVAKASMKSAIKRKRRLFERRRSRPA